MYMYLFSSLFFIFALCYSLIFTVIIISFIDMLGVWTKDWIILVYHHNSALTYLRNMFNNNFNEWIFKKMNCLEFKSPIHDNMNDETMQITIS